MVPYFSGVTSSGCQTPWPWGTAIPSGFLDRDMVATRKPVKEFSRGNFGLSGSGPVFIARWMQDYDCEVDMSSGVWYRYPTSQTWSSSTLKPYEHLRIGDWEIPAVWKWPENTRNGVLGNMRYNGYQFDYYGYVRRVNNQDRLEVYIGEQLRYVSDGSWFTHNWTTATALNSADFQDDSKTYIRYLFDSGRLPNGASYAYSTIKGVKVKTCTPVGDAHYGTRGERLYFNAKTFGLPVYYRAKDGIDQTYFAQAYYKMVDNIPALKSNTIANIVELRDGMVSALQGVNLGFSSKNNNLELLFSAQQLARGSEITSRQRSNISFVLAAGNLASELWLSYRYSYNTTVSDLTEATNYAMRLVDYMSFGCDRVNGRVQHNGIVYSCSAKVGHEYLFPKGLTNRMRNLGINLSAANVWDMIPYSFVVDWFVDISSVLTAFDQWISSQGIPISDIWYSAVSSYDDGSYCYLRVPGERPVLPNNSIVELEVSKNPVTWCKRIADTICFIM